MLLDVSRLVCGTTESPSKRHRELRLKIYINIFNSVNCALPYVIALCELCVSPSACASLSLAISVASVRQNERSRAQLNRTVVSVRL